MTISFQTLRSILSFRSRVNFSTGGFCRMLLLAILICGTGAILSNTPVHAQTTQFTYQGKLADSTIAAPTNGTYEMQFKAFDAVSNGNQFPPVVTLSTVQVVNGIFTVTLDFGAQTFRGADVYLEIGVRPSGNVNPFTVLNPRQKVTSAPYAIQSLNAINASSASNSDNLGNVAANLYVQTNDSRLSDARPPTAGSANYIQNTTNFQLLSNFNISGSGKANSFDAATQFNIGGSRVFSVGGTNNTFAGLNTATVNTGTNDSFFGNHAGQMNTTGFRNSFFGESAGNKNTTGGDNSFFGMVSGALNTTGSFNSFFGDGAGFRNNADNNSFYGYEAGTFNTTGTDNSFFGIGAGYTNSTGSQNSFFGKQSGTLSIGSNNTAFGDLSGASITTGNNNTFLGGGADATSGNISNSTAIGAGAQVATSNTIVIGTNAETTIVKGAMTVFGTTSVTTLGAAGSTSLCRNAFNQISTCTPGNLAEKSGGDNSATLTALREQKAEIEQQQTQVLKQKEQIELQEKQLQQQQVEIDELKKLVCSQKQADVCRELK